MTKEEYLSQLKKYLKRLPKSDYENAIEYFNEYFEDAGAENEQKVIEELGTPKEAAAELLANLLKEKTAKQPSEKKREKKSAGTIILITCLALLAAPLGTPLLISAIILILMGILVILLTIFIAAVFGITGMIAGIRLVVRGLAAIPVSVSGACLMTGAGMLGIGSGICLCILEIYFCKWMALKIGQAGQKMIQRKECKVQ